jgi:Cytidylate kinase-like family
MKVLGECEKARLYLASHSHVISEEEFNERKIHGGPFITISRETGVPEALIYEKLLKYLQKIYGEKKWRFFDKELIDKILNEHHLPKYFEDILVEDKYSAVKSIASQMLGTGSDIWNLFYKVRTTITHLAQAGYVIIIGRGANIITSKLNGGLHVRLIASLQNRISYISKCLDLEKTEAMKYIKKEDQRRKVFLQTYYNKNVEDPLLYHAVINTDYTGIEGTAKLIASSTRQMPINFISEKIELS